MSRRGWVLFALMSVIWGIPYLMIKVAVEGGVSVPVLVFARTALGALVLLPLVLRGGQLGWLRRHWRPLLAFALVEMLVPWALLSHAEERLTSSMAGLLIAASPILAVLVGRLVGDNERLGHLRWLGLGTGLVGVAVLAGPELGGGDTWSVVEVLLTALGYAIGPIIVSRGLRDVPALPLTAVCLGFGAVVYLPWAALAWPDTVPSGGRAGSLGRVGVDLHGRGLPRLLRADP